MMQKGQVVIAGLFLLAVMGFVAVFLYIADQFPKSMQNPDIFRTPEPTLASIPTPATNKNLYNEASRSANWKTYAYTNKLFAIKYPDNIIIVINDYTVKNTYGEYGVTTKLGESDPSQKALIISIKDKNTRNTLEYFDLVYNTPGNKLVPNYAANKKRNFDVNGYRATETEYEVQEYGKTPYQYYRSVMVNKNGNIISLGYDFGGPEGKDFYKRYKPIYEEVISSLAL